MKAYASSSDRKSTLSGGRLMAAVSVIFLWAFSAVTLSAQQADNSSGEPKEGTPTAGGRRLTEESSGSGKQAGASVKSTPKEPSGSPGSADPAGGKQKKKQDRLKKIVREKNVYIPYEHLKKVFEKEGRGIFLPYEEFLRLWRKAQPKPEKPKPDEPPAPCVVRGGHYTGKVTGKVAKFSVSFDIEALKKGWSELSLPFKGVALETVELSDPKALFSTKGDSYAVFLPDRGNYQATLEFSVGVKKQLGRKGISFSVPKVAVSRLELTIPEENVRVDVHPTLAVTQTTAGEKATKVLAFLGNSDSLSVNWMPPAGKLEEEGAVVRSSQFITTYLGERILKISTDIQYQVLRGQVATLRVRLPQQTRLLSVKGENIKRWTQKAETLVVDLHSPLKGSSITSRTSKPQETQTYTLELSFERILEETPDTLQVPFPKVENVIRETGWVVFNHASSLNVRMESTTGLSQLDKDEVPAALRSKPGTGFRYLAHPLSLALKVEKITPRVRSFTTSVVSLGREEDVWFGRIDYEIEKAGVFKLKFRVPARWDVVSVGDSDTVENYQATEAPEGTKTVEVNLKSKALGEFSLPFNLLARGSVAEEETALSPPVVLGSNRDRGLFGVSAPKAFDITTVERKKMTSEDVKRLLTSGILNQLPAGASMPLTYGYREPGSSVRVKLQAKETEIDVLVQHLVEVSEGGIRLTHILDYEILYAAAEKVTFSAPSGLDSILKVEAKEKKDVRKKSTGSGRTMWEVTLQAPTLGGVSLTLSHDADLKALEPGSPFTYAVPLIRPEGAQEVDGFVAVRKEGTLQIQPQQTGMEAIDSAELPDKLRRGQIYSSLRYFTSEPSLSLELTRYRYQKLATTLVSLMHLKSVLSEERLLKTEAAFMVKNTEGQYLELKFPPNVNILSVSVNGKLQKPRRRKEDADTRLIQIPVSANASSTFPVVLVYEQELPGGSMNSIGRVTLTTPKVLAEVPVSKVELDLYLPPDFAYFNWKGELKEKFSGGPGLWSRFKKILNETVSASNRKTPVSGKQFSGTSSASPPADSGLDIEIPTRGYVKHQFETLNPFGSLSFAYVARTLYSLFDFIAFVAALLFGSLFLAKTRLSRWVIAFVFVFIPLACVWFFRGASVEIFTSLLAGGLLLFVVYFVTVTTKRVCEWRQARVAMRPDPYLEEAAGPKPKEGETVKGAAVERQKTQPAKPESGKGAEDRRSGQAEDSPSGPPQSRPPSSPGETRAGPPEDTPSRPEDAQSGSPGDEPPRPGEDKQSGPPEADEEERG